MQDSREVDRSARRRITGEVVFTVGKQSPDFGEHLFQGLSWLTGWFTGAKRFSHFRSTPERLKEDVFDTLEAAGCHTLPDKDFEFGLVDFNGHRR
jgi:hypothetical protein